MVARECELLVGGLVDCWMMMMMDVDGNDAVHRVQQDGGGTAPDGSPSSASASSPANPKMMGKLKELFSASELGIHPWIVF